MGWLLNLFTGGLVGQIGEQLNKAYATRMQAKNDEERVEAERVIATLQARKEVLKAEAGSRWNVAFRVFLALPFGLFVWKVVVIDKLLRLGATDDLSPNMWKLLGVVYSFYFLYETAAMFVASKRR